MGDTKKFEAFMAFLLAASIIPFATMSFVTSYFKVCIKRCQNQQTIEHFCSENPFSKPDPSSSSIKKFE